jgi:hypothetical protein
MSGFKKYLEECKMATVGQPLIAPEPGWKRFDDRDSRIKFSGRTLFRGSGATYYNSTETWFENPSTLPHKINFKFYGTKFRIIADKAETRDPNNTLKVYLNGDLIGEYNTYNPTWISQLLLFEKLNIPLGVNDIEIVNENSTYVYQLSLDAIDIGEDGYLFDPTIPANLIASAGDSQIMLNWDAVTGATGFNVKRTTAAGGPYTTIASNVSGTNYLDSDVLNGITYYYVVTAITAEGESANSNEASATPAAEPDSILRITMNDSSEREYQLTANEVDDFISWFNQHTSTDDTSFMFNKAVGLQISKEYLAFNKIISFEVIPIA